MQIRPYGLMVYDRTEYSTRPRAKQRSLLFSDAEASRSVDFDANTGLPQYKGSLTSGAKKRLKRAIQLLVAIAEPKTAMNFKLKKHFKFKLNFITLTLPVSQSPHSDKEIKKQVLDVWIKTAKRRFKLRSYIWRAERQKNGNLHFHFVTDTYIPFDQLRDTWNDKLNRLGYIDRFEEKHNHRHPNSTDVHAIKNVKNLAGYFAKYMAKDAEEGDVIDGKLWDCSRNLKHKANCETMLEEDALFLWDKVATDPEVTIKHCDYCSIAFLTKNQFAKYVQGSIRALYEEWINIIRNIPNEIVKLKPPEPVHVPF